MADRRRKDEIAASERGKAEALIKIHQRHMTFEHIGAGDCLLCEWYHKAMAS